MRLQTFSQYFSLEKSQHELDFVDVPVNNGDIRLYIDPYAISRRNDRWSIKCHNQIVSFFQKIVEYIRSGKNDQAKYMLSGLREPNQTRLGQSKGKKPRGRGVGGDQALALYKALAESSAVRTGFLKDLEDCELMIEGLGNDKISDITTNIIRQQLILYTHSECNLFNVPMSSVASGPIWDDRDNKWTNDYVELPICHDRSVILVPKAIARAGLEFDHREYYQHFVLNFLQAEHLQANSSLVRVLKSGLKKEPTKKALKKINPLSKPYLYTFSKEHQDVLQKYKDSKQKNIEIISNEQIAEIKKIEEQFDYTGLVDSLISIPAGTQHANAFHSHVIGILTAIFYPSLINPVKEQEIHEGRKRIDLTYENAAEEGFFYTLPTIKQVPSAYIIVECKNYNGDPGNPELDQLSGRFSTNRGKFGFLVCRSFVNKELFFERCRDTAQEGRGFIIPLDDEDLKTMLLHKQNGDDVLIHQLLDQSYRKLVM